MKFIKAERQRVINIEKIKNFFNWYKTVMNEHDIQKEDIWNINKTSLRVDINCD
jgi:hypothetical protein